MPMATILPETMLYIEDGDIISFIAFTKHFFVCTTFGDNPQISLFQNSTQSCHTDVTTLIWGDSMDSSYKKRMQHHE